ncbi:hypothetical protein KR009_011663, partial [Drosophila setifemur]
SRNCIRCKPAPASAPTTSAANPATPQRPLGRRTKLAAPKSRPAATLLKRRNRRRRNDGGLEGSGGAGAGLGGGGGRARGGGGSGGHNRGKEPFHFVPVRRKPLGEYMKMDGPAARPPPLTYAAALGAVPAPKYTVKVMISPRLKRTCKPGKPGNPGEGKRPKKPTAAARQDTKFSIFAAEQPKTHIVHVDSKAGEVPIRKFKGKRIKKCKSKPASQRLHPNEQKPPKSTREFRDAFSYLNHHHEQLQRILAAQTVGVRPLDDPGSVATISASASFSSSYTCTRPYQAVLDERQYKRCELEACALLAQNKSMLRIWTNPNLLIS